MKKSILLLLALGLSTEFLYADSSARPIESADYSLILRDSESSWARGGRGGRGGGGQNRGNRMGQAGGRRGEQGKVNHGGNRGGRGDGGRGERNRNGWNHQGGRYGSSYGYGGRSGRYGRGYGYSYGYGGSSYGVPYYDYATPVVNNVTVVQPDVDPNAPYGPDYEY